MRPELPTGTVTLLFTDIEGSTKLLHELGAEGYAQALADHRRLVRRACSEQNGAEVDTQGDAFFLAFATAPEALAAAQALREAFQAGRIKARVGVHTGIPFLTDEGYVGDDVHRAARIAAAGHGGQVLVSAATASLVEADLRDLGEHRFKDLSAPERVYQLGEGDFPALKVLYETNLPVPSTPFLGREKELNEVASLIALPDVRLLTLTGPGGTGKTRLALQASGLAADAYPDGVYWVPLAAIREPELVLDTAAQILGARDGLVEHIGSKRLLLLFDNFEQVLRAAVRLGELLARCPELKLLATSRERLHLSSEQEYPVPPFAHDEGVSFFLARARAVRPDFEADAAVPSICRRLDDLPLALELAAASVKVLSPSQIMGRLEEALPLVVDRTRDRPDRQRTLRATIEWSYDLLSPEEQQVFRRLAVFAGGFTLEAAESVCETDLDEIALLVDKNLVRRSDDRFSLLETIREYAEELLVDSGEHDALRERHSAHFVTFAQHAEPELVGVDQEAWLERIAQDHENLRTALGTLNRAGDSESVLRLSTSLVLFWFVRGFYAEGVDWLGRAIASAEGKSPTLAKALWGAGFLELLRGETDAARAHLTEGLALARAVGAESMAARTLLSLGLLAFFQNEIAEARSAMEESVEIARRAGDLWCLADGLGTLGSIYPLQGDLEDGQRVGEEGLRLAREARDQQGTRMALFGLALTAVRRGDLDGARTLALEGVAICRAIGDPWFISYFLWILALVSYDEGNVEQARVEIEEALDVGREVGGALLVVCALEVLARIELDEADLDAARRHLDEALTVTASGVPKSYVAAVHLTRSRLAVEAGDEDSARRELELSVGLARECGDTWAKQRALAAREALDR